jgi:hypothetical protein
VERLEALPDLRCVALLAVLPKPADPLPARLDLLLGHVAQQDILFLGDQMCVHAHLAQGPVAELSRVALHGVLEQAPEPTRVAQFGWLALRLDAAHHFPDPPLHLVGERFHVVRAPEWIGHPRHSGLELNDLLRAQAHQVRLATRDPKSLVEGGHLDGLGTGQGEREGLGGAPDHVVHGLLGGEREARGVSGDVHGQRARIPGAELAAHHAGEQATRGADLGDLLEEIEATIHQDRDPRGEGIDRDAALQQGAHDAADLDEPEGHLFHRVQAPVADEVGVLEKGVELRHLLAAKGDRVHRHPKPKLEGHVEGVAGVLAVVRRLDHRAAQHGGRDAARPGRAVQTGEGEGRL